MVLDSVAKCMLMSVECGGGYATASVSRDQFSASVVKAA